MAHVAEEDGGGGGAQLGLLGPGLLLQPQLLLDLLQAADQDLHLGLPLGDGEILAKVDHFAFTANNVTYGVVGGRIGYWKFFPTAEEGWGIIPVWGFADVIESNASDIAVGERLYGYWPMATHLVMAPTKVRDTRMIDGVAHRAELPPVYNAYARVKQEPGYDGTFDDDRMALYPLYATSY